MSRCFLTNDNRLHLDGDAISRARGTGRARAENFRREVAESGVDLESMTVRGARAVARFAAAARKLRDRPR